MYKGGAGPRRELTRYSFYNGNTGLLLHFIRAHLSDWNILKAVRPRAVLLGDITPGTGPTTPLRAWRTRPCNQRSYFFLAERLIAEN